MIASSLEGGLTPAEKTEDYRAHLPGNDVNETVGSQDAVPAEQSAESKSWPDLRAQPPQIRERDLVPQHEVHAPTDRRERRMTAKTIRPSWTKIFFWNSPLSIARRPASSVRQTERRSSGRSKPPFPDIQSALERNRVGGNHQRLSVLKEAFVL